MNILIVDDELIIRQWFRMLIQSLKNTEFNIVGEVQNGKIALDFCRENHVDLIITDIKMPVMDGLTLIECIKKEFNDIEVIILTAHEEFEYVRQALKLGALNYILKCEIEISDLEKQLNDVIKRYHHHNEERTIIKSINNEEKLQLKNLFLNKLIRKEVKTDEITLKKSILDLDIEVNNNLLLYIELISNKEIFDPIADKEIFQFAVINVIEEIGKKYFENIICFHFENNGFFCIAHYNRYSEKDIMDHINQTYEELKNFFNSYFSSNVYIGFELVKRTINNIGCNSTKLIKNCSFHRFYSIQECAQLENETLIDNRLLNKLTNQVLQSIEFDELENAEIRLKELILFIVKNRFEIEVIENITMRIIFFMNEKIGKGYKEDYITKADLTTFLKCESYLLNKLKGLKEIKERSLSKYSTSIRKALCFIQANYDKEISLGQIAKEVNLNQSYLSELFSKEIGLTYSNYLNKYRIDKSKILLRNKELSVQDIGGQVGFNNLSYFTKTFKKLENISPSTYRKSISQKNDNKIQ